LPSSKDRTKAGPAPTSSPQPAVGVLVVVAFVAGERQCDHPMLDLKLFAHPGFSIGSLTLMLGYFGALGTYFLYTQHLQFVLGYSALRAGVYSIPFAVALVAFSLQTPGLIKRVGTAKVAGIGLTILSAGVAIRALSTATTGFPLLLVSLVVCGIGVGLTVAPSTGAIMSSLSPHQAGVGSAINDAARQVGAATGVAVLGSVWSSAYRGALTRSTVGPRVPDQALRQSRTSIGSVVDLRHSLPKDVEANLVRAAKAAFVHGSNVANVVGALVVLVAAGLAFSYLPRGKVRASADHDIDRPDMVLGVVDPETTVIDRGLASRPS
jgi:MFS family permease